MRNSLLVDKIVGKSPALFLAYASLRRTLRRQHELMRGLPTLIVLVIEESNAIGIYKKAADLLLSRSQDIWLRRRDERRALVRVLEPSDRSVSDGIGNLEKDAGHDVVVVIVPSRDQIPLDLLLTADAIVDIERPTKRHVHAVRHYLGRWAIDDATAGLVAELDFGLLVRVACKRTLPHTEALGLLASLSTSMPTAPLLEDLPGNFAAKVWGKSFIEDLCRCRNGNASWWSVMPRGVLLHGPPGTGKTLFAQALARSSGLPMISASVSQWQSAGHLGDMLKAMRKTFETARAKQPAIVFLDELDSIGDRAKFKGDYVDYSRQVVNQLLECIDGAEGRDQILIVGATNFSEAIDPALLRGGRIERHIRLDLPNSDERADILRYHLRSNDTGSGLQQIANDLVGWSGADLEMLAREAKALAARNNRPVGIDDLVHSLPTPVELSEDQALRVAIHEAGHAVVGYLLRPNSRITVSMRRRFRLSVSAEQASGLTKFENLNNDELLPTRAHFEDHICLCLAGAAAEECVLGSKSNGFARSAGSDLDRASALAVQMVTNYGFGRSLRFLVTGAELRTGDVSSLPADIREEVSEILDGQYRRATWILNKHVLFAEELANELLQRRLLDPSDVDALASKMKIERDWRGLSLSEEWRPQA